MLGVTSKLLEILIPDIEAVGKRKARARYAGVFHGVPRSDDTMAVAVDDGPALHVTDWQSEGRDILNMYGKITSSTAAGAGSGPLYSLRLYPTCLDDGEKEAWRAVYTSSTPKQMRSDDPMLFMERGSCQTWSAMDEKIYDLVGLDDFVFSNGKGSSHFGAVSPRAFRQTLQYQKKA